jgi:serine/threonine protein kinase
LSKGFNKSFGEVVAVKTLKGLLFSAYNCSDTLLYAFLGFLEQSLVRDLLRECTKMSKFDHPNVLTLIGVCVDGGPAPYIIMPFMFNGSLLSHLKKERENLVLPPEQEGASNTVSLHSICICTYTVYTCVKAGCE